MRCSERGRIESARRAPEKDLRSKDFLGRRSRRRKRKQLGLARAVSKRALRTDRAPEKDLRSKDFLGRRRDRHKTERDELCSSLWDGCRVPTRWCRRADLNRYALRHRILSPACLPISPRRHSPPLSCGEGIGSGGVFRMIKLYAGRVRRRGRAPSPQKGRGGPSPRRRARASRGRRASRCRCRDTR